MTDKLPPQLLALFAPRPPLRWVGHADEAPEKRRTAAITGLAEYLPALNAYKEQDDYKPTESWLQARDRKMLEAKLQREQLLTEGPKDCKYHHNPFFHLSTDRTWSCRRCCLSPLGKQIGTSQLPCANRNLACRQARQRPQHSWRRLQDSYCGASELRCQRKRSGEGIRPIRPY
jgi:hypothetical protein